MLTKKFSWLVLVLAIFSFTTALNAQTTCAPSFFFVVHARSGQIVKMPDNSFQFRFQPMNQQVIYFSDRPKRITGKMPVATFLSMWTKGPDSFKADHPNGSIGVISGDAQSTNTMAYGALVLSHPAYNAANNTLSFTVTPLKGSFTEEKMKYLTIFIDSVWYPGLELNH